MKRTPILGAILLLLLLALAGGWEWLGERWETGDLAGRPTAAEPAVVAGVPAAALQRFAAEERDAIAATLVLIEQGGPFPYRKDGSTFQNREGRLPARPAGYYREYTVETPSSPDRGARRIVAGAGGEVYYTRDHYATFIQLK